MPPPPLSPYPGRATPAHPQSRVSAKARALYRVSAKALCRDSAEALESLLKLCSFCAHTPDRRIALNLFRACPPDSFRCFRAYAHSPINIVGDFRSVPDGFPPMFAGTLQDLLPNVAKKSSSLAHDAIEDCTSLDSSGILVLGRFLTWFLYVHMLSLLSSLTLFSF